MPRPPKRGATAATMLNAQADFKAPLRFGDTCRVELSTVKVGKRSLTNRTDPRLVGCTRPGAIVNASADSRARRAPAKRKSVKRTAKN